MAVPLLFLTSLRFANYLATFRYTSSLAMPSWRAAFAALGGYSEVRLQSGIERARSFSQAQMRSSLFCALRTIWGEDFLEEVSKV